MPEPRCLLGLDAGNTVIKAVLFDLDGRQLARAALDGGTARPHPGHVERDLGELWRNASSVIGRCLAAAGVAPEAVAAVGCAGHGNGLYAIDSAGDPVVGIQSLDGRAAALAAEVDAAAGAALHPIALQRPWPAQTPMLMVWLRRHRPDLWERIATVLFCKDYVTFRITGERVSEVSDMSGAGLVRLPDGRYDDELLALYGLADARERLPRLLEPTGIAGHVTAAAARETGLAPGTPVIGGFFDVIASALGAGVERPGEASIVAGSWSINQVFSDAPVTDERVFMVSRFGPRRFVTIESSATSAVNLEWYVRELVARGGHTADPFAELTARLEAVKPRGDDPFFHPFLFGARDDAASRAGFYGIAGWHGEGHLLRALFEGVAFEHRRHIDRLTGAGLALSRATLSGGGAQSPVWPQIFADVLKLPVTVAEARETGALGAAIGAALAIGEIADYGEGVRRMTRAVRTFEPDPVLASHHDRRYETYLGLIETLRGFWSRLAATRAAEGEKG